VLRKKEDVIVKAFAMAVTVLIVSGIITTIVAVNQKNRRVSGSPGPPFYIEQIVLYCACI